MSAATEEARKIRPEIERDRQEWQPIETAPKDGMRILACWRAGSIVWESPSIVRWHFDGWAVDCVGRGLAKGSYSPTHWLPLPTPPKEAPDV